jgi:hypothetical protein
MQRQPSRAPLDSGSRVTNCFSQDYAQTAQVAKGDVALVAAERLLWVRRAKGQPQRERRSRIWFQNWRCQLKRRYATAESRPSSPTLLSKSIAWVRFDSFVDSIVIVQAMAHRHVLA